MKSVAIWSAVAVLAAVLAGCKDDSAQAMPEVNDETCTPEYFEKIEDENLRRRLGDACFRRVPEQKPSEPKEW